MTLNVKISHASPGTDYMAVVKVDGAPDVVLKDGEAHAVVLWQGKSLTVVERDALGNERGSPVALPDVGKPFAFDLDDPVTIDISGERGTVIGRAQYTSMPDQYQGRYVNAAGCAVEQWWPQDQLARG